MKKKIIFWIILIILIALLLGLNYVKFFGVSNDNIEEKPVENSTSEAINTALQDITNNFNNNQEVSNLTKDGITVSAVLNNYSIFISYAIGNDTTTYEFNYSNLILSIDIENNEENIKKFNTIYKILINACQERLTNEDNIDSDIDKFLNGESTFNGIDKSINNNIITYKMDITKKHSTSNEDTTSDNNTDTDNSNDLSGFAG